MKITYNFCPAFNTRAPSAESSDCENIPVPDAVSRSSSTASLRVLRQTLLRSDEKLNKKIGKKSLQEIREKDQKFSGKSPKLFRTSRGFLYKLYPGHVARIFHPDPEKQRIRWALGSKNETRIEIDSNLKFPEHVFEEQAAQLVNLLDQYAGTHSALQELKLSQPQAKKLLMECCNYRSLYRGLGRAVSVRSEGEPEGARTILIDRHNNVSIRLRLPLGEGGLNQATLGAHVCFHADEKGFHIEPAAILANRSDLAPSDLKTLPSIVHAERSAYDRLRDIPGIVRMYASLEMNSAKRNQVKYASVLELGEMGTLKSHLDKLDPDQALMIMHQLLRTLTQVHHNNILHLDIKPENVVLTRKSGCVEALLCDFGNSTWVDNPQSSGIGSYDYLSPEYFDTKRRSCADDVFALGVLCYLLLFKELPFFTYRPEIDNPPHLRDQHLHEYQNTNARARKKIMEEGIEQAKARDEYYTNPLSRLVWDMLHPDPNKRLAAEAAWRQCADIHCGAAADISEVSENCNSYKLR